MVSVSESSKLWRPLTFTIEGAPRANSDLKQHIADVDRFCQAKIEFHSLDPAQVLQLLIADVVTAVILRMLLDLCR